MSLDERVRAGLHRSADSARFDEDDALDNVQLAHRRVEARARVLRQATSVAVVLTLIAGIGILISWRAAPDRYRTTATVAVTQAPSTKAFLAKVGATPPDPLRLAKAPTTRRSTLDAAQIAPNETRIHLRAARTGAERLSLAVTAPTTRESEVVLQRWVAVLGRTRDNHAGAQIVAARRAVSTKIKRLHNELRRVDSKLAKLMPLVYGDVLQYDSPNSRLPNRDDPYEPPPVPEQGSVEALNLAYRRIELLKEINTAGESLSVIRFAEVVPDTTKILEQAPTTRVGEVPTATWIALSGWFVALLLVLVGAVAIYRRSRPTQLR